MKKIIFVMDSLRIGGIQSAFINMLNAFDYTKYEVSVFFFHLDKKDIERIPKQVTVLERNIILDIMGKTAEEAKRCGILQYICRKFFAGLCLMFGADLIYSVIFCFMKRKEGYDCAISYTNNITKRGVYFGQNKYTLEKIEAKCKVTWLHVDYEAMNMNCKVNNREYEGFDMIVHVSEAVMEKFVNCIPKLKENSTVIYNIIDEKRISILAKQECQVVLKEDFFNIVTVGRLDENKSMISCVRLAEMLMKKNVKFNWWILGDGPQYLLLEKKIVEYNLEETVHLMGYIENPACIVSKCDLFVSVSKSESYGLAIAEALCLGTPVIVKEYPAVHEVIKDNGIIVKTEVEMFQKILELYKSDIAYDDIKKRTALVCTDGENMKKLYELIDVKS